MKIIISTYEIKIKDSYYPFNKIYFKADGDIVKIFTLTGKALYNGHYSNYRNSSDVPFTSTQSVIDSLRLSFS